MLQLTGNPNVVPVGVGGDGFRQRQAMDRLGSLRDGNSLKGGRQASTAGGK